MSGAPALAPLQDGFKPGRLWSLRDMIDCYLTQFVMGRQFLFQAVQDAMAGKMRDPDGRVPEPQRLRIDSQLRYAMNYCVKLLQLKEALATCANLENLLNNSAFQPYTWDRLHALSQRLWEDIDLGIQAEYFYHYPRAAAMERLGVDVIWKDVLTAFPSARREIEAGIDCNALRDFSGAIFHMMRAAELGLRVMAKERGIKRIKRNIPLEYATWGQIIEKIETEMEKIRIANAPKGAKEQALKFYSTAASDFRQLVVLRDETMHFRYKEADPGQAQSAIFRVKSLLTMLASKLDENSTRKIPWSAWK